MSHKELDLFQDKAQDKASDTVFKKKLQYNITQYDNTVIKGKNQYADLELARRRAKNIKWKAIENMDGAALDGRNLRVNEAEERKPREGGGGFGGGGGGRSFGDAGGGGGRGGRGGGGGGGGRGGRGGGGDRGGDRW